MRFGPSFLPKKPGGAFSLIEVVLALGIVAFCLVPLLGLIPTGLLTVRDSQESFAASDAMRQISDSIRGAVITFSTNCQAPGAFSNLTWTLPRTQNGSSNDFSLALSDAGVPTAVGSEKKLVAQITIYPPAASRMAPGRALINVAWPGQAVWNASNSAWTRAQGSISTWIYFQPES